MMVKLSYTHFMPYNFSTMKSQPSNFIPTTHQDMAEVPQVSSADGKAEETFALS